MERLSAAEKHQMKAKPAQRVFGAPWLAVAAALLAVFSLHAVWPFGGPGLDRIMSRWLNSAVCDVPGVFVLARAIRVDRERAAWLLLGGGLLLWGLGNTYLLLVETSDPPPVPSPADGLWLAFYALSYVGFLLLMRSRIAEFRRSLWLDGVIGGTAVAAVVTAIVFGAVVGSVGGSRLSVATNLAYPLADMLLLALVVGALAAAGWRPGRSWAWIACGFAFFAVSDSIYLVQSAHGSYVTGRILDAGWPLAMLLIALAAAQPSPARIKTRYDGWLVLVVPAVFAVLSVGVLVYDHFHRVTPLALALAGATIFAVIARMALTFGENLAMIASSRHDAATDALTGLANRRTLLAELTLRLEAADERKPWCLLLFDLNGFKTYNDSFGHLAGDALLVRLGKKLAATAAGLGTAYRMGGDEFCALVAVDEHDSGAVTATLASALSEQGEGFEITASCGAVQLPAEAADPVEALRLADQRMYAHKRHVKGRSEERVAAGELARAVATHGHELSGGHEMAVLAAAVGRRLGLDGDDVRRLERAAAVHDVGKLAIPSSILEKPGPLDQAEWEFVWRHTVGGEKILSATPALEPVAEVVRSTHENYDGTGYPDHLARQEIPLAARIVFVCDAFEAMTSDRPHQPARSVEEALEELRRCSGTQFDPAVVEAFCAVVAERRHLRLVS